MPVCRRSPNLDFFQCIVGLVYNIVVLKLQLLGHVLGPTATSNMQHNELAHSVFTFTLRHSDLTYKPHFSFLKSRQCVFVKIKMRGF